jgi:hypothetical protein
MATVTFDVCRGAAPYSCRCASCGKSMTRKAVVEHTVNPFNKNADGSVKSRSEVWRSAKAAAEAEAAAKEGSEVICRDCEDAPNKALLLEMAARPHLGMPEPADYWRSPMRVLEERKHVRREYERCKCGADCCSGYKHPANFFLTEKGKARAASLLLKLRGSV